MRIIPESATPFNIGVWARRAKIGLQMRKMLILRIPQKAKNARKRGGLGYPQGDKHQLDLCTRTRPRPPRQPVSRTSLRDRHPRTADGTLSAPTSQPRAAVLNMRPAA